MLKIFRKVRHNMIKNNKVTAYILYAIGEIVLVMIGILLAMQVNNWNEERIQKTQLNSILKTVSLDLKTDTIVANSLIDYYKENEKNSLKIINREIKKENYKDCPQCAGLITVYRPFNVQTKGYNLLTNFSDKNSIKNDSLVTQITQFYPSFMGLIDDSNGFIKNEVLSNIESFKKHSWFVDWTQGKVNDDMIYYFTESEEYRKQVAAHNLLAAKNHLLFVTLFKQGATSILGKINERLEAND